VEHDFIVPGPSERPLRIERSSEMSIFESHRREPCNQRVLLILLLLIAAMTHSPRKAAAQTEKPNPKWRELVESLATRNPKPEIVVVRKGNVDPRNFVPLFSPDYDWVEYRRVVDVFLQLAKSDSPELWEELVKHIHDDRYALTMQDDWDVANWSVGKICARLAWPRVNIVSEYHSDPTSRDRPDVFIDPGIRDLPAWRKSRAEKSLYELQVEVCERTREKLADIKGLPNEARARIRKDIDAELTKLKKTKQPLFYRIPLDGFSYFTAEKARDRQTQLLKKDGKQPMQCP
jgi:hypothetical protein